VESPDDPHPSALQQHAASKTTKLILLDSLLQERLSGWFCEKMSVSAETPVPVNGKMSLGTRRLVVSHVENAASFYAYQEAGTSTTRGKGSTSRRRAWPAFPIAARSTK